MKLDDILSFGKRHSTNERLTPEEAFTRRDEDLINAAEAMKSFIKSEGWILLESAIEKRRQDIGLQALEDESHSKDWWKGYAAGTNALSEVLEYIKQGASQARDELGIEQEASERMKTEGGDLAL